MSNFNSIVRVRPSRKKRESQRTIIPSGVKSRNLGNVVFSVETSSASTSLADGEQAILTATLIQNDSYPFLGNIYISAYAGAVSASNLLPGGSSVDESQWQIIPQSYDFRGWELEGFVPHKEVVKFYVRNISAGTTTVNFRTRGKYISPFEGAE